MSTIDNLKPGMLIRRNGKGYQRCWIVLPVTKKDLKRGINAPCEGLYGFGGMWYGRNPMKHRCYGKIANLTTDDYTIVRSDIHGLSVDEIQRLVD